MGWLKPEQCIEIRESVTFWVDQRELPSGGIKLAEIPTGLNGYGEMTSFSLELFVDKLGKFDKVYFNEKDRGLLLRYHFFIGAGNYGSGKTGTNDSALFAIDDYYNPVFFAGDYYRNDEFGFEIKVLGYEGEGTASRAQAEVTFFCPGAEDLKASPAKMTLKKGESKEVTVTVTGASGCAVEGETVTATVISGQKRATVSPSSGVTDENGQTAFTITAKKICKAKVVFKAGSLQGLTTVRVTK